MAKVISLELFLKLKGNMYYRISANKDHLIYYLG